MFGTGLDVNRQGRCTLDEPAISVVIPVRNGAAVLPRCLEAVSQSTGTDWECIVVDDGSTDDTARIAHDWNARLLHTEKPKSGPGQARNLGAAAARSTLLCFLDADIVVRPDTLASFVQLFESQPNLSAAFGSYDTQPAATNSLSQYRNLLHHFVHQTGQPSATTFWAGCGAIRKDVFLAAAGFSPEYTRPSIEDIELGYRLWSRGAEIRLAKHIQVTHLKRWTFWSILRTDVLDRALPWTRLIRQSKHLPNDLNLQMSGRVSALCVFLGTLLFAAGWLVPLAWVPSVACLVTLVMCNRRLYGFFIRHRGIGFLLRVVLMHWLYFAYSAMAFLVGSLQAYWSTMRQQPGRRALTNVGDHEGTAG